MGSIRVNDADGRTRALEAGVPGTEPTSRLSCQIIWDAHLDGLELTLPGA